MKELSINTGAVLKASAEVKQILNRLPVSAWECVVTCVRGIALTVRELQVETLEHQSSQSISLKVFRKKSSGTVGISDFRSLAIKDAARKALLIADHTPEDPYAGLPDEKILAWDYPDLNLAKPWDIGIDQLISKACQCEKRSTRGHENLLRCEGVNISSQEQFYLYQNSLGFVGFYPTTVHNMDCSLVVQESANHMQRDYEYSVGRGAKNLLSVRALAQSAQQKTLLRRNARKISTRKVPVVFEASLARGILRQFINAVSGSAIYQKNSFLLDALGQRIFPKWMTLTQYPHRKGQIGSSPFDLEGVVTREQSFVQEGVLQSYILGSYSARKLGLQTTGNSGGVFNLQSTSNYPDLPSLLRGMKRGLFITELMGQGINPLTGDYSRGAFGFWVEKGEIAYPVHEITVAGNLRDMFKNIRAIAADVDNRGSIQCGSMWIDGMIIGGE